ncbi:MAG: hypothetical protein K6A14_02845 [Erysipelotrichaceae bacterium]|nr:hypothetical protein [Erysipelotrichaceae bacterium]
MINALDYLNSRSIRNYWEEIGYQPSPVETAWLIWQSEHHTIAQKHEAWQMLIDEAADCDIVINQPNCESPNRLHAFLQDYMAAEDAIIRRFFTDELAFYQTVSYTDDDWHDLTQYNSMYNSVDTLPEDIIRWSGGSAVSLRVTKWILDPSSDHVSSLTLEMNTAGEPMSIVGYPDGYLKTLSAITCLSFDFPLPFKPGDIIDNLTGAASDISGPFVLKETAEVEPDRRFHRDWQGTHCGPVAYYGYFIDEDGELCRDKALCIMSGEYHRGSLSTDENKLTALSSWFQGEIPEELLLRALSTIDRQSAAQNACGKLLDDYDEDLLPLAGVSPAPANSNFANS